MTGSLDVTPDDLRKQASELEQFAKDVRAANTSAANRDLYAYGAIGLVWAGAMDERFSAADQFANDAADAADRVAEELKAMATDYETEEREKASGMQHIRGDLS